MKKSQFTETRSAQAELAAPEPNSAGEKRTQEEAAKFPGLVGIAIWLLLEALIGVAGVLTHHFASHSARLTVLAVATLLALGSLGLFQMKRWGWALALAASFLTSSYGIYIILRYHENNYWVMTIANFIFFFYLVRPEILRRLR